MHEEPAYGFILLQETQDHLKAFCHQSLSKSSKNKKHILEGKTERQNRCLRFGTSLKQDSHPKVWAKSSFPLGNAGNQFHPPQLHSPQTFQSQPIVSSQSENYLKRKFQTCRNYLLIRCYFQEQSEGCQLGEEPSTILASRLDTLMRAPCRLPYKPEKEQLHSHGMTPF